MKKLKAMTEKIIGRKRTVSVRLDESVLNFIDYNGGEWERDRSKQINFILGQYSAGNFKALEDCHNGIGRPKARQAKK